MENPQLKLAYDYVAYTDKNIFLTGKAGTGKTTFLHSLKKKLPKRMIVVAPTGVAAINAGGVTIHSFFQLSFGPIIPKEYITSSVSSKTVSAHEQEKYQRFSKQKINIIKSLDLLIIDEISMVRADLLDGIDEVLRRIRRKDMPFGGVQLLMIGDLQQLSPVVKDNEWEILREFYQTAFFFSSKALAKSEFTGIELTHIYRQSDEKFIQLLNRIRTNDPDETTLFELNKRFIENFNPPDEEGYITLTTHNQQAHNINQKKLTALPGKTYSFTADIYDDFPEFMYPNDFELELKVDAQVMFIKNDISPDKLFYNGKIGRISKIVEDTIFVSCENDYEPISVNRVIWHNTKYSIDDTTKEIKETIAGTFTQYPLKAAWAITIHKSQGLTFEKAIIDANASFAHGQVYVALSRCKSLEGMVLSSIIAPNSIKNDSSIYSFSNNVEQNQPDDTHLAGARSEYELKLLHELFDFGSIQRTLTYLHKQLIEHKESFLASIQEPFEALKNNAFHDIFEVAGKFKSQLTHLHIQLPDIGSNILLQERVTKAATYFFQKTSDILSVQLDLLDFGCDNKVISKSIDDTLERFTLDIKVKLDCLQASKKEFTIATYLSTKAIGTITPTTLNKVRIKKISSASQGNMSSNYLFNALREWRNHMANESNMPAFTVLHQKTLVSIAELMPTTIADLIRIKGIGKRKAEFFGDDILKIIKQYLFERNLPIKESENSYEPNEKQKKKQEKPKSILQTLELFNEGKTLAEVAIIRNLSLSTIEGHVGQLISKKLLQIRNVMEEKRISKIAGMIIENPTASPSELKQRLGDDCSWEELRWVRNHLRANEML